MLLEESAEHAGQDVLGDGHGGTDTEGAGGFAVGAIEGCPRFFRQACAFAGVPKKDDTGIGKANATLATVEEGDAQLLFEGVNLLADRGLAEMEALGCTAEAEFFGDGAKDLKPEILHRPL